jgi:copper chaperone NosL
MYDFYLWEYDYGHNLDPNAPIKIEGQAYQPPLIGQKTLLNFLAKSYPHLGGMAMFTSMILAFLAYWIKKKTKDYETANTSNAMPVADGVLTEASAD